MEGRKRRGEEGGGSGGECKVLGVRNGGWGSEWEEKDGSEDKEKGGL